MVLQGVPNLAAAVIAAGDDPGAGLVKPNVRERQQMGLDGLGRGEQVRLGVVTVWFSDTL